MQTAGWLLILVCMGLPRLQAQVRNDDRDIAAILALEQAWSDAESRGDNVALDQIFDNTLVKVGTIVQPSFFLTSDSSPRYPAGYEDNQGRSFQPDAMACINVIATAGASTEMREVDCQTRLWKSSIWVRLRPRRKQSRRWKIC